MQQQIKASLRAHADEKHSQFVRKLIPTATRPILGVRMGVIRQLAKQIAKGDWRQYHDSASEPESMEELMVQALSLGYLAPTTDIEEQLRAIAAIVPQLDNWSLIDSSVSTYKFVRQHRPRVWDWLQSYLYSQDEYLARFGVVMLLMHFAQERDYAPAIADALPRVITGPYYTDMAVAWCLCELYTYHKDIASPLLNEGALSPSTQRMARQKIRDSFRCELD